MACVTHYGSYEFIVMPFVLTNAPATFCTLMKKVLASFLNRFVVVYLDDIVIYSKSLEKHVGHLRKVFRTLRDNHLYVKKRKVLLCTRGAFPGPHYWQGQVMHEPGKGQGHP